MTTLTGEQYMVILSTNALSKVVTRHFEKHFTSTDVHLITDHVYLMEQELSLVRIQGINVTLVRIV